MGVTLILLTTITLTVALPYQEDSSNEYEYPDLSYDNIKFGHSLARAITYNKPTVPLQFWEKVKKKPRGRQLKESKLLGAWGEGPPPLKKSASKSGSSQNPPGPFLLLECEASAPGGGRENCLWPGLCLRGAGATPAPLAGRRRCCS